MSQQQEPDECKHEFSEHTWAVGSDPLVCCDHCDLDFDEYVEQLHVKADLAAGVVRGTEQ